MFLDTKGHPTRKYRGQGNRSLLLSLTLLWGAIACILTSRATWGKCPSVSFDAGGANPINKKEQRERSRVEGRPPESGTEVSKP